LSSDAIADMANQLAYAHKHNVPFPFLLGFLTHVGFDEAARKAREGTYEDWHPSATKQASKPVKEPVARQKARRSDAKIERVASRSSRSPVLPLADKPMLLR